MRYWWASQSRNWRTVIDLGTLWAPTSSLRGPLRTHSSLKEMERGDVVFHYGAGAVRAVSRVSETWKPAHRPDEGYPKENPEQGDEGWLVRVEVVASGLELPSSTVSELVSHGSPGPLDTTGDPGRRYVSPLSSEEGVRLLAAVGVQVDEVESLFGLPVEWAGEATDAAAFGRVRMEQAELRAHLLAGFASAPCALCGRVLPARLLIAAHIAPRHALSDEQRRRFDEVAMLVCALGCDALFEWGYVTVDGGGIVRAGTDAPTDDLRSAVAGLVGKRCAKFNASTAPLFAERRKGAQGLG